MGLMDYDDDVGTVTKPRCFGDAREHSTKDPVCQDCRFFRTCAIIVRRKLEAAGEEPRPRPAVDRRSDYRRDDRRDDRQDSRRDGRRGLRPPDPEDYIERDDDNVSFWSALIFNGAMSGIRAGLVEAVFASDQIPRFQYPDPFRAVFKRTDEDK